MKILIISFAISLSGCSLIGFKSGECLDFFGNYDMNCLDSKIKESRDFDSLTKK